MKAWLFLVAAIVAEVVGTSFLKESHGFTKLVPSLVSLGAYGVAFFCLSRAMLEIELGMAYAIWAGLGTVLIVLVGWLVFKQSLDWAAVAGVGLIIVGVVVLNLFSEVKA